MVIDIYRTGAAAPHTFPRGEGGIPDGSSEPAGMTEEECGRKCWEKASFQA